MRIDIMTLFPELVDTVLSESIIGRARAAGTLDIRTYNIRDYSEDRHRRVDDTPYGGGMGMLMAAPPIYNCYEAVLKDGKYMFNGVAVLDLRRENMLNVRTCSFRGGSFVMEGIVRLSASGREYRLLAEDDKKNRYEAEISAYPPAAQTGLTGRTVVEGERFRLEFPAETGRKVCFIAETDGEPVRLKPGFDKSLRISALTFMENDEHIARLEGDTIVFTGTGLFDRMAADRKGKAAAEKSRGAEAAAELMLDVREERKDRKAKIEDRVAFISVRSDGCLLGNMEKVYEAVDLPKTVYAVKGMSSDPAAVRKAKSLISTSKVVVTDDYLYPLRSMDKKKGQYFVQLWHATGAGKHFGKDGSLAFPATDALYHKDYDLVTVSAEGIRDVYASAFGINVDRVEATGVARTDDFFDEGYIQEAVKRVYGAHPELEGKKIILYTPTFRDLPGVPRSAFRPEVDFGRLSEAVGDDCVLVLCPHPVMTEKIIEGEYANILEIRDVSTNDMMFVSDMMITDYSSTMFEYSLFHKPIAFFCYDYDDYDRDFYMDFEKELPGRLLKTQEELFAFLRERDWQVNEDSEAFNRKYMGACDGHSTERIAARIEGMFNDRP